jgi:hypothetical protein
MTIFKKMQGQFIKNWQYCLSKLIIFTISTSSIRPKGLYGGVVRVQHHLFAVIMLTAINFLFCMNCSTWNKLGLMNTISG